MSNAPAQMQPAMLQSQQQQQYGNYQERWQNYTQQPPQYGYNAGEAPPVPIDSKPTFEQTFEQHYEKPGWNDVWAGILVRQYALVILLQSLTWMVVSSSSSFSVSPQSAPFPSMVTRRRRAATVVCDDYTLGRREMPNLES
jgi:hypothetical protein